MMMTQSHKGFTLIEMVIVIILTAVVFTIAGDLMYQGFVGVNTGYDETSVEADARVVLQRMVREIRTMRTNTDLTTMTATSIAFKDVQGDVLTYSLSGDTLSRNSQVVSKNISALTFTYLDANGDVTATAADVYFIYVTMTFTKNSQSVTINSTIFLRNVV